MSGQDGGVDGFGPAARRAIAAAAQEAIAAGTTRVGTEHLLLGVLAVESCGAAVALRDAGLRRSAARRKVAETNIGAGSPTGAGASEVKRSPRADRALHRAHRFAHDHRSPEARSEHLLLGVLDVEGTAGQVLRGLGVDVDSLRHRLLAVDLAAPDVAEGPSVAAEPLPPAAAVSPRCPGCRAEVAVTGLTSTTLPAGDRAAVVVACAACGLVLGAGPA